MIIVKLTIFSIVITVIWLFSIRVWAISNPDKEIISKATKKYPKWAYGLPLFFLLDILGILSSTVYLLFLR